MHKHPLFLTLAKTQTSVEHSLPWSFTQCSPMSTLFPSHNPPIIPGVEVNANAEFPPNLRVECTCEAEDGEVAGLPVNDNATVHDAAEACYIRCAQLNAAPILDIIWDENDLANDEDPLPNGRHRHRDRRLD